jgi:hypothetical protein
MRFMPLDSVQDFVDAGLFHEIHVSEIREFKKCKRSHKLKYVEQWYPNVTQPQLSFGTCIHAAKEVYFDPERWTYSRDVSRTLAELKFREELQHFHEETKKSLGSQYGDKEAAEFAKQLDLGIGMLSHYFGEVSPRIDTNMVPTHVEQSFAVAIHMGNEYIWCRCDKCSKKMVAYNKKQGIKEDSWENGLGWKGLPVVLEGKIDLIYRNVKTNKYWLLDWKTAARIYPTHAWLDLDEQLSDYVWAMRELGLPVAGFRYHEDWKAYPKEPERLARPYRGCAFSTSKTQPTTYEIAKEVFETEDPFAFANGNYDNYLQWLAAEGPQFWNRETIRKTTEELTIVGQQIYNVALDMTSPQRDYISPSKFGCMYCDFFNVCVGMQQGADWKYTLNSEFKQKAPYYADKEYEDQ